MAKKNTKTPKTRSLRDLLLVHELIFIILIILAVMGGIFGIHLWDKSAKESQRIHTLVQETQQTRGDLYRQMKELFDAFLLSDTNAKEEYKTYTISILKHFQNLERLAVGAEEQQAIADLKENYKIFVSEAPDMFYRYQTSPNSESRKALYQDMETGIFSRYETVSKRVENLLTLKQNELKTRLQEAKQTSIIILSIPVLLAGLLLIASRTFLKCAIVKPIHAMMKATREISTGNLQHQVPDTGAEELSILSQEINKMADDLAESRDALVRTEKQAALGLLVPMLAHNIRNPLASIRATAQVIDVCDDDKETQESINGIMSTVDRLERWTTSLLAYLHPVKPALSKVSFKKIVLSSLVPLQQKLHEKNINVSMDIQPEEQTILTDEHLLEQVFYNLILNAIEASPPNSEIQFTALIKQNSLEINLTDQGSGMPFTPAPNAISPGKSTKRFGTGLGIPFTFKACEVLNGSIKFQSIAHGGTQITLQFPQ
ncbi:MAG: ATP-binding protein [Methylophilaceae bacterium]|nr:ATP-binding protein [Methylophilaceae bacterium]